MKRNSTYKSSKLVENKRSKSDWWNEITEEGKTEIEKGLEDVKAGRIVPQTDVKKRYEKWL